MEHYGLSSSWTGKVAFSCCFLFRDHDWNGVDLQEAVADVAKLSYLCFRQALPLLNGVVFSNRSTSTAPCFRSNLAATSDHGQYTAA